MLTKQKLEKSSRILKLQFSTVSVEDVREGSMGQVFIQLKSNFPKFGRHWTSVGNNLTFLLPMKFPGTGHTSILTNTNKLDTLSSNQKLN